MIIKPSVAIREQVISLYLQHEDQLLVIKVLISYFFPQIWIHHFNWKFQWFIFFLLAGRGGQRSLQSLSGWCRGEESRAGQHQEWDYHSDPRDGLPVWPHPQGRKLKYVKSLKTCSFKLKPGWVVEIMHTSTDKLTLAQSCWIIIHWNVSLFQVTVNWFQLQQAQVVSLPVNYQTLCENAKLYEPGQRYIDFVRSLPTDAPRLECHSLDSPVTQNTGCDVPSSYLLSECGQSLSF